MCVVTCLDDDSGAVCCLTSSRRVDCCLISSRRADEAGRLSIVPSDISDIVQACLVGLIDRGRLSAEKVGDD